MYNITVGRFADDPAAQGVVRPADDSWQLVVDKDGLPHLYLRVRLDADAQEVTGGSATGWLCLEDLLPDDCKVRDLVAGDFGGRLPPDEEAAAHAEYLASREKSPIPCPR